MIDTYTKPKWIPQTISKTNIEDWTDYEIKNIANDVINILENSTVKPFVKPKIRSRAICVSEIYRNMKGIVEPSPIHKPFTVNKPSKTVESAQERTDRINALKNSLRNKKANEKIERRRIAVEKRTKKLKNDRIELENGRIIEERSKTMGTVNIGNGIPEYMRTVNSNDIETIENGKLIMKNDGTKRRNTITPIDPTVEMTRNGKYENCYNFLKENSKTQYFGWKELEILLKERFGPKSRVQRWTWERDCGKKKPAICFSPNDGVYLNPFYEN